MIRRDHLYRDVPLPYVVELPVLGVRLRFACDSPSALDLVQETYGSWSALADRTNVISPSTAEVRIVLHDPAAAVENPQFSYRVPDPSRLLIASPGSLGVADTQRLEAMVYVTEPLLAQPAAFVEGMLDPLTLFLVGALDRQPLHAAAVVRRRAGVLLAGPSGSGKSTLSYAAFKRGYSLLADEAVHVQLTPQLRVWGRRARLHLPPDAAAYFPELRERSPERLMSGKMKIVIELPRAEPPYVHSVGVCLVRLGAGGGPALDPLPPDKVVAELTERLEPGFDLFRATIGAPVAKLAERGGWRLTLSDSPEEAAPFLDEILAHVESR